MSHRRSRWWITESKNSGSVNFFFFVAVFKIRFQSKSILATMYNFQDNFAQNIFKVQRMFDHRCGCTSFNIRWLAASLHPPRLSQLEWSACSRPVASLFIKLKQVIKQSWTKGQQQSSVNGRNRFLGQSPKVTRMGCSKTIATCESRAQKDSSDEFHPKGTQTT